MHLADMGMIEFLSGLDRIGMAGIAVGACIAIWRYWTARIVEVENKYLLALKERDTAFLKELNDREATIANLQVRTTTQADNHAGAIERLQGVTIEKMEEWGGHTRLLVERMIQVQADTNATVRQLGLEPRKSQDS